DLIEGALEVLLRLLVGPGGAVRIERLQSKGAILQNMAAVARCMSWPLLKKNRFHVCFEELEIESLGGFPNYLLSGYPCQDRPLRISSPQTQTVKGDDHQNFFYAAGHSVKQKSE